EEPQLAALCGTTIAPKIAMNVSEFVVARNVDLTTRPSQTPAFPTGVGGKVEIAATVSLGTTTLSFQSSNDLANWQTEKTVAMTAGANFLTSDPVSRGFFRLAFSKGAGACLVNLVTARVVQKGEDCECDS